MTLDFIAACNATTIGLLDEFRRLVATRLPAHEDGDFYNYRFNNPYFGYVDVENDSCSPFYMLNNNDDLVAMHYLWYGRNGYERASVREWVMRAKKARVVFDVGANTGLFALLACRSNDKLEAVVAFEPTARAHSRIMENLIVNALVDKIAVEQKAVSDMEDRLELMHYDDAYQIGTGASLLGTEKEMEVQRREICETVTLDDYAEEHGLWPDLMKIDVEGAEVLALKGAERLLSRRSATILIEVLPSTAGEVVQMLDGYKIFIVDDANNTLTDYDLQRIEHYTNLLVVPPTT